MNEVTAPRESNPPWKIATEILAVGAGITTFCGLVGGLTFAARLHALDLPVDAAVALLPLGTLLVAGVRAMLLGLVLVALLLILIWTLEPTRSADRWRKRATLAVFVLAAAAVVTLPILNEPLTTPQRVALAAAGGVAALLAARTLARAEKPRGAAYVLPALILVLSAAVHGLREYWPPTPLDYVTVRTDSGDVTDGYYLASDGGTIYLAPNVGRRTIGVITTLPRTDVRAVRIDRQDDDVSGLGRELPRALLGRHSRAPGLTKDEQRQRDDLADFAAGIRTGNAWVYPPIVPPGSLEFLLHHYEEFEDRVHDFPQQRTAVPIAALLRDPQVYVGRDFVTRGEIVEAAIVESGKTRRRWLLVVRPPGARGDEADCNVTEDDSSTRFPVGHLVDLHAVVVAWGSFNIRAGRPISNTSLACGAARLVPARADRQRDP